MKILFPRPNAEGLRLTLTDYEYYYGADILNTYPRARYVNHNESNGQMDSQLDISVYLNKILVFFIVFGVFSTLIWIVAMYTIMAYVYRIYF